MRAMIKVIPIFVLFIMVVSCATTQHPLPEKYSLDNYLEAVKKLSAFKVTNYENIDNQSVLLEADRNSYYLLVLRRPIDIEYSNLYLDISNTVTKDEEISTQKRIGPKTTAGRGPNTEFVQGPSKIASTASGSDRIVVKSEVAEQYYVIEKIYRLKGKDQAEEIKQWLRNN